MISEAGKVNVRDRIKMIESQSPRRTQSHMSLSSRHQTRNFHPKIKAQSQNDLRYTANDHRAQELSMQSIKKFDQDRNIEPTRLSTIIQTKAQECELDMELQRQQAIKEAEEAEAALYGQTLNNSRYEPKVLKDPRRQGLTPERPPEEQEPEAPQQKPQPKVEEISLSGSRGNTRSLRRIESKKMDHIDIVSIPIIPEPTVFETPVVVVAAAPPTSVVHKQMVITETISLVQEGSNFLSIESFDLVTVDDNVQPMERNSPCNSDNDNPRDAVMVSTHEEHGIQVAIRNQTEESRHSYEIRVNVEQPPQLQQQQQREEPVVETSSPGPAPSLKKVDSMPMTDDSSIDSTGSSLLYDGSNTPDDDKDNNKKIRFSNRVDIREISDRGSNSSASSAYDRQVRKNRGKKSFWLRFICSAN
jgi:hypothetical protein